MKEFKKIIICGTGRCGTKSMKCILENCQNCISTHEFNPILPWNFNEKEFKKRLNHFNNIKVKYYSDAGSWYLNYLERFIKEIPDIKIIILIRDKQKVIPSYIAKCQKYNFWNHEHTDGSEPHNNYDKGFPNYGDISLKNAIDKFWDKYNEKASKLINKYPKNVIIVNVELLNSTIALLNIFKFLGIDYEDTVINKENRKNIILNL